MRTLSAFLCLFSAVSTSAFAANSGLLCTVDKGDQILISEFLNAGEDFYVFPDGHAVKQAIDQITDPQAFDGAYVFHGELQNNVINMSGGTWMAANAGKGNMTPDQIDTWGAISSNGLWLANEALGLTAICVPAEKP